MNEVLVTFIIKVILSTMYFYTCCIYICYNGVGQQNQTFNNVLEIIQ